MTPIYGLKNGQIKSLRYEVLSNNLRSCVSEIPQTWSCSRNGEKTPGNISIFNAMVGKVNWWTDYYQVEERFLFIDIL